MLKCDNGGIVDLDLDDASFWIGKKIENLDFLPENYLISLNGTGKYFMPKFIEWQYSDISSNKNIVVQARQILDKYNLINPDFTLNLDNSYITFTKDLPESQVTGNSKGNSKGKSKGNSKDKEEQEFDFVNADYSIIFSDWIQYKKSRNENYKNKKSLEACYRNLLRLANDDPDQARLIVDQSMGNNWAGLFPIKKELLSPKKRVDGYY